MEPARKPPDGAALLVTAGDPAGIGPELVLKLADDFARTPGPLLYFSTADAEHRKAFEAALRALGRSLRVLSAADFDALARSGVPALGPQEVVVIDVAAEDEASVRPGVPGEASGRLAFAALRAAADWIEARAGACRGLLTAPVSKEWIARGTGRPFPGHTDYLARRFHASVLMLMHGRDISVVPLTIHLPLARVPAELPGVLAAPETAELLLRLRELPPFDGRDGRRWALCGLNPHAGEGGELGREELDFIAAAAEAWRARGLPVDGPLPADGVFMPGTRERFALILACYHDQGLAPFKALEGDRGVNCTIGLPFARTSPDHGTAFDIAGRGKADPTSMRRALEVLYSGELTPCKI